jgi:outer membrane protein
VKFNCIFAFLSAVAIFCEAQTDSVSSRIGYADADHIFSQLPVSQQVESELKSVETQLLKQIETKDQELKQKYEIYIANEKTMLEPVRNNAREELQMLAQSLEKLRQEAATTIQNRFDQLTTPVYKNIINAIETVAKEKSLLLVLSPQNSGGIVILFADERIDISNLIIQKLNGISKPD